MTPNPTNPSLATALPPSPSIELVNLALDSLNVVVHHAACLAGAARLDRSEDLAVLLDRALWSAGHEERGPERALHLAAKCVHQVRDDAVPTGLGHRQVEGEVGADVGGLAAEAVLHRIDRCGHLREVARVPTLRRERRGLTLDDPPRLEQLALVRLVDRDEQGERLVQRVPELRDDEAPVAAALDQAAGLEHPQRLAHGGAADLERLDELALGGHRGPRLEAAGGDQAQQPLGHELVGLSAL